MTRDEKSTMCALFASCKDAWEEQAFLAALTDDPAPTAPGDPQALVVADRCDALAKREEWNECEDAVECALTEAATILRRAPGPDLDALEKATRAGFEIAGDNAEVTEYDDFGDRVTPRACVVGARGKLEAAIAEMRREAGEGT